MKENNVKGNAETQKQNLEKDFVPAPDNLFTIDAFLFKEKIALPGVVEMKF